MRTIPATITNGLAAHAEPVVLITVITAKGTGTSFRWSTLATSKFTSWAGNAYAGRLMDVGPTRHMSAITKDPGKAQLGELSFNVMNPDYSGGLSLWDYAIANSKYWKGAQVTARLIYNYGSSLVDNDTYSIKIFEGICRKTSQTITAMKFYCQDETKNAHVTIPRTQINADDYPNWDASGFGNENNLGKVFPICFGEGDFKTLLYDTASGYCNFRHDTEEQYDAGTFSVYDEIGDYRESNDALVVDSDENGVKVGSADIESTLHFKEEIVPADIDSTINYGDPSPTPWTNEANAIDDDDGTYASAACDATHDPAALFSFENLPNTCLDDAGLFAVCKVTTTASPDYNTYRLTLGNSDDQPHIPYMPGVPAIIGAVTEWTASDEIAFAPFSMPDLRDVASSEIFFWGIYNSTTATVYFYEFFKIIWKLNSPVNDDAYVMQGASGRIFGDTWNSRKTAANMIATFPDAIEAILRQELGLGTADIDEDSFDAALTAINAWSGKAYNDSTFEISGQLLTEVNSEDFITELCRESGLHYCVNPAGQHQLHMITSDVAANYTITTADIMEGSLKEVETSDHADFYNSFVINFDKHPITGVYRQTITINKDSGIASGGHYKYLQDRCQGSYDRYHVTRIKTIDCDWIASEGTAWKLMDWYCYFYCFERKYCSFKAKLHGLLKVENMDVANIVHILTEASTGEKYLIYESKTVSSGMKGYTEHKGMYIESMGERDDGEPE